VATLGTFLPVPRDVFNDRFFSSTRLQMVVRLASPGILLMHFDTDHAEI
jgi:hypothetical protein